MNNHSLTTNNYYLDTIDPSNLLQSSNSRASLGSFFHNECTSIDDWLADELCKEGLLFNSALLPHTPPISPFTSAKPEPASPNVPLFPEIAKQTPILPKANLNLARIAPRPCATVAVAPMKPLAIASSIIMSQQKKRRSDSMSSCAPAAAAAAAADELALKRQKNTDAARRSRLKKFVKMEQLEQKVSDVEADNHRLTTRIAVLESEKSGLQLKDASLEKRVRVLEAQLSEAHRALTKAS